MDGYTKRQTFVPVAHLQPLSVLASFLEGLPRYRFCYRLRPPDARFHSTQSIRYTRSTQPTNGRKASLRCYRSPHNFRTKYLSIIATMLQAPVSGSKKPAEDGTLIFLTAGEQRFFLFRFQSYRSKHLYRSLFALICSPLIAGDQSEENYPAETLVQTT